MSLTLVHKSGSIDGMSKVVNLQRYKMARVLIKDLNRIVNDYEYVLRSVEIIQAGLGRYMQYRSPMMTNHKLNEFKYYLQQEIARVRATIKFEKGLIERDSN
jgi:hypothetical protein